MRSWEKTLEEECCTEQVYRHKREVQSGERFTFGENWGRFLRVLREHQIEEAESSLKIKLMEESLAGKSFLDIGSGSGLSSLAARNLTARVHSFDYDPQSVACTKELKERFFPNDSQWIIESGSVLDSSYLKSLGKFDIVYSWGVLHHTGAMWEAIANAGNCVSEGGKLFIAIYNDQGRYSNYWKTVKRIYNWLPTSLRFLVLWPCFIRLWGPTTAGDLLRGRGLRTWRNYASSRGMSAWRDVIDWVGGYPFEVAKPEEIFYFYQSRGFILEALKTCGGGTGCNEFVFTKIEPLVAS